MKKICVRILLVAVVVFIGYAPAFSQQPDNRLSDSAITEMVKDLMKEGDIPGLSLVIVNGERHVIRTFGYADIEKKKKVTDSTLFEIGSCTKAFTSLAAVMLEQQKKLDFDIPVSYYIPWFNVTYKGRPAQISVRNLLNHTSGIPWSTISKIPQTDAPDALEITVRQLRGQALVDSPGSNYEYATINYDVLALVIQQVSKQPFEDFVQHNIIDSLGLTHTTIGYAANDALKAQGYKIGFFKPRKFDAPHFRGNNAAGYVISNAIDMAKWVKFQIGLTDSAMYELAKVTQQRDETVPPHSNASYAMGWEISLKGDGEIAHGGLNPNYTSHVVFRPKKQIGIVVLANSNSSFTSLIANKLMTALSGDQIGKEYYPGDANDKAFSVASIMLALYILLTLGFVFFMIVMIIKGERKYENFSLSKLGQASLLMIAFLPVLFGLYIMPQAIYNFNWDSMFVWTPVSFFILILAVMGALAVSFLAYLLGLFFPEKNQFKRFLPRILLLSLLSGLANMMLVVLITSSLDSKVELKYLVFYYLLAIMIYLSSRRFVQVKLIKITNNAIYEVREKIIKRIFSTSYQKFEQMDRGRVYTTLNDDAGTIGESVNMFVGLATSLFTAIGAFLYLASIASWATMLAVSLILALLGLYYSVSKRTNKFFNDSRDSKNVFMRLINGAIDGFKELSLHQKKKKEYMEDVLVSANSFRVKMIRASIMFVNASVFGELVLILILGSVSFAFPTLFPDIKTYTLMSFLIVLLYLIGPVNTILGSVPSGMRLKISWNRMQQFLKDIPESSVLVTAVISQAPKTIESIEVEDVGFQYTGENDNQPFTVGPINLEIMKGEILFIIGANGSGKTTLAKLITGLYAPDTGRIKINGKTVTPAQLGEYFSTVFCPIHLFERLYSIDIESSRVMSDKYLKMLDLDKKVELRDKHYSTINLSGGQRKRLALLQCYLEDSPVFLFDEWAADQDPSYRNFFYRTLLPAMKDMGKIVIAITHDDHYFDVADKVLKMENGKLESYYQVFA